MRSDTPSDYTPGEIRVNLVTGDSVTERRNLFYAARTDHYIIQCTRHPVPYPEADIYVIPAPNIHDDTYGFGHGVIPFIAYGPADNLRAASALGCVDYLKDPWTPEELHFRVMKLNPTSTFSINNIPLTLAPSFISSSSMRVDLSRQERAILGLLVFHRGECVEREALSYVSRGKAIGSSRVVDMHVSNLRKKLVRITENENDKTIVSVKGSGYLLNLDTSPKRLR